MRVDLYIDITSHPDGHEDLAKSTATICLDYDVETGIIEHAHSVEYFPSTGYLYREIQPAFAWCLLGGRHEGSRAYLDKLADEKLRAA